MLLGELFKTLFQYGVCLITTSNIAPDGLYQDGLQRERFLPAIAAIKAHVTVIELTTIKDYRQRHRAHRPTVFYPLNADSASAMTTLFDDMTPPEARQTTPLTIHQRPIPVRLRANRVLWCQFNALCGQPRAYQDYLTLIQDYDVFFVSDIPDLNTARHDQVITFIHLIDVLYDNQKHIVMSAAVPIQSLYTKQKHRIAFQRTQSRLIEMQSNEYWQSSTNR